MDLIDAPPDIDLALYIVMRTDLASLNAGKGMAQSAHAATALAEVRYGFLAGNPTFVEAYTTWIKQAGKFGTTLTKDGGRMKKIHDLHARFIAQIAPQSDAVSYGLIVDPTYPLVDGDTVLEIELPTCSWYFGPRRLLHPFFEHLPLHP